MSGVADIYVVDGGDEYIVVSQSVWGWVVPGFDTMEDAASYATSAQAVVDRDAFVPGGEELDYRIDGVVRDDSSL